MGETRGQAGNFSPETNLPFQAGACGGCLSPHQHSPFTRPDSGMGREAALDSFLGWEE